MTFKLTHPPKPRATAGALVKFWRQRAGLTQHDLAEAIASSRSMVNEIEGDRCHVPSWRVGDIADALDLDPDETLRLVKAWQSAYWKAVGK